MRLLSLSVYTLTVAEIEWINGNRTLSWDTNGADPTNWCEDPYAKTAEIHRPILLMAKADVDALQLTDVLFNTLKEKYCLCST
jgi:hypothetical protein